MRILPENLYDKDNETRYRSSVSGKFDDIERRLDSVASGQETGVSLMLARNASANARNVPIRFSRNDNRVSKVTLVTSSPYNVVETDEIILCTNSALSIVNLRPATGDAGKVVTIKNQAASAANVNVTPSGGETIDGVAGVSALAVLSVMQIVSDGSNWNII